MTDRTPYGFPDLTPDELPEGVLFLLVGLDPAAAGLAAEVPDGAHGLSVQMNVGECHPALLVACLRATADSIEAQARAERAGRN